MKRGRIDRLTPLLTALALLMPAAAIAADGSDGPPLKAGYDNGFKVESRDGNHAAKFKFRAQTRVVDQRSSDLPGEADGLTDEQGLRVQRSRFKVSGHAYREWLKYSIQFAFERSALIDFYFDIAKSKKASLRVGQYKAFYGRERLDSSGKQQAVDRSIVNSPFTVDRQQGVTLFGRLFRGTRGDSTYSAGVFTGTGRGGPNDDDRRPLYTGRWQWNFLKKDPGFGQTDVKRSKDGIAAIAIGAATNKSRFSRFSSSGGGQLSGFAAGIREQYKIKQWESDFVYKKRGFSGQAEYHSKEVEDRVTNITTELHGHYAQVGYFFHEAAPGFPEPLELAVRTARVDPDRGMPLPEQRETTLAASWYFKGHDNKLSADVSFLNERLPGGRRDKGWRVRLQWDISF